MASDFTRGIKVYIDSQLYGKSMKEMTAQLEKYHSALDRLNASGQQGSKEADRLRQSIDRLTKTQQRYEEEIRDTERILNNLSGSTYNELIMARNRVRAQLREMVPGTEKYNQMLETLRQTQTRLAIVTQEMNLNYMDQRTMFQKLSSALNKYFLVISAAVSSAAALIMAGRKAVEAYSEVEEHLAKIRKYAGLSTDEVHRLSRELMDVEKIDTRTSHLKLLELAADAGRLGIKGVDNLKAFVTAADKINLALGEDLGKDAVTNIGKLANLFGEDKRIGLENAMLSTASAVTKLAKSSTACEPYLVSFASRLGGIGSVAGITTGDILGLGSALDQNMQKVEMSSTALSTLITKLFQEPAKFARLAMVDVEEFTRMVKTDANEALLVFLSAMQRKGGFDELAPMFSDMEMSGKRAVQVLSTLASHVDQVREAQQIANAAYTENIEVQHEFDIINDTVEARLEKRKKQLQALRVELGEELMPVMVHIRTAQSILVRSLKSSIDFFIRYRSAIVSTTLAIAGYVAVLKIKNSWEKISLFFSEKMVTAVKALFTAIKSNPIGLLLAGLTAIIGLARDSKRRLDELKSSITSVSDVMRSAGSQADAEGKRMKALLAVIADETLAENARLEAMNELRSINDEFLGCIDAQRLSYDEAAAAVQRYLEYLRLSSQLEEAMSARQQLSERLSEEQDKADSTGWMKKGWLHFKNGVIKMFSNSPTSRYYTKGVKQLVHQDLYESVDFLTEQIAEMDALIEKTQQDIVDLMSKGFSSPKDTDTDTEIASPATIESIRQLYEGEGGILELEDEYLEEMETRLKLSLARREISEEQYNVRMARLKMDHNSRLLDIYDRYSDDVMALTVDDEKERDKQADKIRKARLKTESAYQDSRVDMEKSFFDSYDKMQKLAQKNETDATEKIETEYRSRLASARSYAEAMREYVLQTVTDFDTAVMMIMRINQVLAGTEKDITAWRDSQMASENEKAEKERRRAVQKYVKDSLKSQYEMELEELESFHEKGLLLEKEYQKARRDLAFSMYMDAYRSIEHAAAGMVESLEEMEVAAAERKYDILIREAENAGEDTEALEMELANRKLEIQKKYALSNLMVKLSEITADTAVAIMQGFAELGPIGGAAAAAFLATTGIAQYAAAFDEYNRIKSISLKSTPVSQQQTANTGTLVVQYAKGKYDVIGEDDGRLYRGVPYIGEPKTGIVSRPALIAERGEELIVSAPDLERLRMHTDFALVASAINDARLGRIRQHAEGSYPATDAVHVSSPLSDELLSAVLDIAVRIDRLPRELRAYVLLSDLNRQTEIDRLAKAPFTRKDLNRK